MTTYRARQIVQKALAEHFPGVKFLPPTERDKTVGGGTYYQFMADGSEPTDPKKGYRLSMFFDKGTITSFGYSSIEWDKAKEEGREIFEKMKALILSLVPHQLP